ncbi:uncharacterized protein [Chironomus tepperi]|uniref:uncharacterized protein n=1 Tax=Chironomus tepperi TaxID=113505 RepID=UPI00391F5A3F
MPACPDLETFINHLESDDIYELYGKIRGNNFYLGAVQNDMMVFGNIRMVSELDSSFHMYIDATFGVTPFHAEQLLVVMAEIHQKPRPIGYVLMTSRTEKDYVAVLEHMRDSLISFDGNIRVPSSAMCDYEKGLRNALVKVWPEIAVKGCLFHMTKALRQKARNMKELSTKIKRGTMHHKTLLMFSRLALLPLNRIDAGLAALKNFISSNYALKKDFGRFIEYFDRNWMGRYNKKDWCVVDCPRRTNNHCEGHNSFIKMTIKRNPSPWTFIDGLIDLIFEALSSMAAEKENFTRIDRSQITNSLTRNLIKLNENCINELEFLKLMI